MESNVTHSERSDANRGKVHRKPGINQRSTQGIEEGTISGAGGCQQDFYWLQSVESAFPATLHRTSARLINSFSTTDSKLAGHLDALVSPVLTLFLHPS